MIPDLLLSALFGVLEGVTEWLPISSTGHLILLRHFVKFPTRPAFFELFEVVIQLGAILAVGVLYFETLNPITHKKSPAARAETWRLWGMVLLAAIPSALLGLLLDDFLDAHLYTPATVAVTLILYGIAFIVLELYRRGKRERNTALTPAVALGTGAFQMLSLIPGTSRSGATILGGLTLGLSRTDASRFSFFLGIPTMLGASALKAVKFVLEGNVLLPREIAMLTVGALTAFLTSLLTIRTLLAFLQRHTFIAFGIYRILLGLAVIALI